MDDRNTSSTAEARIQSLESALAHQQRDYELLNDVVIEQSESIAELRRKLALLESTLREVQQLLPHERDLVDEKPPHY